MAINFQDFSSKVEEEGVGTCKEKFCGSTRYLRDFLKTWIKDEDENIDINVISV